MISRRFKDSLLMIILVVASTMMITNIQTNATEPTSSDLITRFEMESYIAQQDIRREQLVKKALESMVQIKVAKDGSDYQGSGFFISPATIITNKHVVDGYEIKSIKTQDGTMCIPQGITTDDLNDLAFIETDCSVPYLTADNDPKEGQDVYALGNPEYYNFTVTKGIVSAFRGQWIQFDAYINHGNSGGPLINAKGEVIGIVTMKSREQKGVALALAISAAKVQIERSLEGG